MKTDTNLSDRSMQYYIVSKHWATDLDFFKIETSFLSDLLDGYFIRLADKEYIDKLKEAGKRLSKLEKDKYQAETLLTLHLKQLELAAENVINEDAKELGIKHVELEGLMAELGLEEREVKKEIFTLIGRMIKDSKVIAELYP